MKQFEIIDIIERWRTYSNMSSNPYHDKSIKQFAELNSTEPHDGKYTTDDIVNEICRITGIEKDAVLSPNKTRRRENVLARKLYVVALNLGLGLSLEKAAEQFGQTHSNAIYYRKTISNMRRYDRNFYDLTSPLWEMITSMKQPCHTDIP